MELAVGLLQPRPVRRPRSTRSSWRSPPNPSMAEAYNLRGLIYCQPGRRRAGRGELQARAAAQPARRRRDAQLRLVPVPAEALRRGAARSSSRRWRSRSTATSRAPCWRRACARRAPASCAEAERTLQRAYELDPANPVTALNLAEVLFQRGEYERARFYIRRVNASPQQASAQTLWLAARIETRARQPSGRANDFGAAAARAASRSRARRRPSSRGSFDE